VPPCLQHQYYVFIITSYSLLKIVNISFLYRDVLFKDHASVNKVLKTALTHQVLIYHVAKLQQWNSAEQLLVNCGDNKMNKESYSFKVCLEGQRIYVETLMTVLWSYLEPKWVKGNFAGVFSKNNFGGRFYFWKRCGGVSLLACILPMAVHLVSTHCNLGEAEQ
jgi:hypothetical protein